MSEEQSLKDKTAKGLFWGGFSNGIQQLLNLVFGIFIARLLTPSDYGMVGMLAIFSLIAGSIQESGFTAALVNKKEVTHKDYNAVFWFNIITSLCLYLVLLLCAPLIAYFFYRLFHRQSGNLTQCLSKTESNGQAAGHVLGDRTDRIRHCGGHAGLSRLFLLGICHAKHCLRSCQHCLLLAFHPLAAYASIQPRAHKRNVRIQW